MYVSAAVASSLSPVWRSSSFAVPYQQLADLMGPQLGSILANQWNAKSMDAILVHASLTSFGIFFAWAQHLLLHAN
jgi:hypothetical protein